MKVMGLDRKLYNLALSTIVRNKCSELHLRARLLLKTIFPGELVFEEVSLPGSKTSKNGILFLDFLLPNKLLGFEVQGEQHEKYTPMFHKNRVNFGRAQQRDSYKREWCELNNILLIELNFNETDEIWRQKIEARHECSSLKN